MRNLLIIAVLAAMTYAFAAQAFTPVITAPHAFSWFTIRNIQSIWFCRKCGSQQNDTSNGRYVAPAGGGSWDWSANGGLGGYR